MAGGREAWRRPLGATPVGDGSVEVRAWAPRARSLGVLIADRQHELGPAGDGVFEARVPGRAGDDYWLLLDGERRLADPCSRHQPRGTLGPSRVVDSAAFRWSDGDWQPPAAGELVVYELHVGAFSDEGTFEAAIPHLGRLRELGVTAIELMPVAAFPGERGWGYDGIYLHAPHHAYGGPEGLARLVDAAHGEGLAVLLDVVYNHLGPGAGVLEELGPYFSGHGRTPWGPALALDSGPVREWIVQSACRWACDYHVDGFRLDAVWAMGDESTTHAVEELVARVRAASGRPVLVTAEGDPEDPRLRADRLGWGVDVWWSDGFHHALHALLTGERGGHYAGLGALDDLVRALGRPARPRLAVYAQNHDQVGNRPRGDRLPPELSRLAACVVLFSPFVPLLFMGEEHTERRPFPFFTDHPDEEHAERTRRGRRRDLLEQGFVEQPLEPQDAETFALARLDRSAADEATWELYRSLVALRGQLSEGEAEATAEGASVLRVRRGPFELVCNLSGSATGAAVEGTIVLETGGATQAGGSLRLPPFSAAVVQRRA